MPLPFTIELGKQCNVRNTCMLISSFFVIFVLIHLLILNSTNIQHKLQSEKILPGLCKLSGPFFNLLWLCYKIPSASNVCICFMYTVQSFYNLMLCLGSTGMDCCISELC